MYKGEFNRGFRNGKGRLEKDGKIFEAEWCEGEMDEETKVEKESTTKKPLIGTKLMMGALSKMIKDKYLEELERQ